jgi:hypothetical protein
MKVKQKNIPSSSSIVLYVSKLQITTLENVLSAGYPKKYPATSMSQDLLGTEVLLGTFRYIPGTLTGTLLRNV